MIDNIAFIIVLFAAFFLIIIALLSFIRPKVARSFLNGFAGSFKIHVTEMVLRMIAGWAIISYAPYMRFSGMFRLFGWALVITSVVLLIMPWRWHAKFAETAVRPLTQNVWIFGVISLPLGSVILYSAFK